MKTIILIALFASIASAQSTTPNTVETSATPASIASELDTTINHTVTHPAIRQNVQSGHVDSAGNPNYVSWTAGKLYVDGSVTPLTVTVADGVNAYGTVDYNFQLKSKMAMTRPGANAYIFITYNPNTSAISVGASASPVQTVNVLPTSGVANVWYWIVALQKNYMYVSGRMQDTPSLYLGMFYSTGSFVYANFQKTSVASGSGTGTLPMDLAYVDQSNTFTSPNTFTQTISGSITGNAATANYASTAGFVSLAPGTGGIQSTLAGEGTNAIDLQTIQSSNTQIASGNYSSLLGGWGNTASGSYSTVLGGYGNTASGNYSIAGGQSTTCGANNAFCWTDGLTPTGGGAIGGISYGAWFKSQYFRVTQSTNPADGGFFVDNHGYVGIGETMGQAPAYPLDVWGIVRSANGGFMFPDGTVQITAISTVDGIAHLAGDNQTFVQDINTFSGQTNLNGGVNISTPAFNQNAGGLNIKGIIDLVDGTTIQTNGYDIVFNGSGPKGVHNTSAYGETIDGALTVGGGVAITGGWPITAGSMTVTSSATASAFFGDGSHLTGISTTDAGAGHLVSTQTWSGVNTFQGPIVINGGGGSNLYPYMAWISTSSIPYAQYRGVWMAFDPSYNGWWVTMPETNNPYTNCPDCYMIGSNISKGKVVLSGGYNTWPNASFDVVVSSAHYVGISTGMPQYPLDVNGAAMFRSSATASAFYGDGSHLTGLPSGGGITALTGDVTASGSGSVSATLASISTPGTYGSATVVPTITMDAKGRITSVSSNTIVAAQTNQANVFTLTQNITNSIPGQLHITNPSASGSESSIYHYTVNGSTWVAGAGGWGNGDTYTIGNISNGALLKVSNNGNLNVAGALTVGALSPQAIATSYTSPSYVQLGSLIIQWGTVSLTDGSTSTITFAKTFTSGTTYVATVSELGSNGDDPYVNGFRVNSQSAASMAVQSKTNGTNNCNWIAIGY